MDAEIVTVSAGGNTHAGFSEMELDAAFNHAVRTFWFRTAPSAARLKTFGPGTKVDIFFNGDLACRGFIDRVRPGFHYFSFSGRSIAQDLVDCAALDESGTGNFENQTLLQVGQSLGRQFGVNFATDQQLANIDSYQITPGETAFSAIEKLSREQGLTLAGQPDGSINITKPGSKRHAGGLFEGVNILFGEADLNWAHRHSPIIVRGQTAKGTGNTALQVEAQATDSAIWSSGTSPVTAAPSQNAAATALGRYRPLVHIEDTDVDQPTAQALADARSQREAGESLKANVLLSGFHDQDGMLWTPGFLVWIESELLGLTQAMMIKSARFTKKRPKGSSMGTISNRGTSTGCVTFLELVDPRAFGGNAAKGSQTGNAGDIWNVGAPAVPSAPGASVLG